MFQALQQRRLSRLAVIVTAVMLFSLAAPMLLPPSEAHAKGPRGFMPPGHMKRATFVFFIDLDDSHWAAPFVGPMHRLSIIRGYPDGKFQPNKPVTQVEALVMIMRALGLEDELDDVDRYPKLPGAARWAAPYVALADEKGLLDELPEFNPMKPASRAWVAALLVAAAGIDEDAVEEALGIQFRDMDEIPAELQVFVRLAVTLGWFQGYPGNWFKPNKPVTRAEMAALIARFLEYEDAPAVDGIVRGTITEVDDDGLTLRERGGNRTYAFADELTVVVDGRLADVGDLRAGMRAWAHVLDGEIVHISARGAGDDDGDDDKGQAFEVSGPIQGLETGNAPQIRVDGRWYDVADDVDVHDADGRRIDFDDLEVGWRVRLSGETREGQRVVTRIRVLDQGSTERVDRVTLYDVDVAGATLDVVYANGNRNSSLDASDAEVYDVDAGGKRTRIRLAALVPGDTLELVYKGNALVEIRRTGKGSEVIGVITQVRLSGSSRGLTIDRNLADDEEDVATYRFAAVVDVADSVPGLTVRDLGDLDEGHVVRVTLTSDNRIIAVLVTGTQQ